LVSSATPCCSADIATGEGGNGPQFMHVTPGHFYLTDSFNNQLKWSTRPFKEWTVLAGNGSRPHRGRSIDGLALQVPLNEPHGFTVTSDGSGDVYIADTFSSCIRLLRDGVLTTIAGRCGFGGHADGAPHASLFQHPHRVNLDPRNESELYVSDSECWDDEDGDDEPSHPCRHTDAGVCFSGVRKIELDRSTGLAVRVSTVVGQLSSRADGKESRECIGFADGNASSAKFHFSHGVAFSLLSGADMELRHKGQPAGGSPSMFIMDELGNRVRKLDFHTGIVTTIAGTGKYGMQNGPGSSATFSNPAGLGLDLGDTVYVADYASHRIRVISPPTTGWGTSWNYARFFHQVFL